MSTETVTISRLGAQGDGIAHTAEGPVYVPFALPGETVAIARVKTQGTVMSLEAPSPDRIAPACRHFGPEGENGTCGGCTLQHYADAPYRAFKRQLVVDALKSKGLTPTVNDLVPAHAGERRRMVMTARGTEKGLLLGFNQAGSHHIVAIAECPVASAGITAHLGDIRKIAAAVAQGANPFRVTVLETLTGLDIAFDELKSLPEATRARTVEVALACKPVARVSVNGEILIEMRKPLLDFAGAGVSPNPGGFTQATRAAEEAMARLVTDNLGKAKQVADLFAGAGTFTFRLAKKAKVHAVESDEKALKALDQAVRNTQGLKPITTERRDLFRRPLLTKDLSRYDAIVFDPPRAGAEAQCRELARAKTPKVIAVSCNPITLARDLALLVDGGYKIESVTPIDQFLWSGHVEAVAVLGR
jgi:23S rRNA (uracil1939-C5)-methyltransferase